MLPKQDTQNPAGGLKETIRTQTMNWKQISKVVGLVLAVVIAVGGIGCGKKGEQIIILGAVLPLTGDAAVWGNNTKDGIDLAVEEINNNGGVLGRKLRIQYEDSKALPNEGVSAYNKLVSVHKVPVIIDNSISSVTLAMAPLAERDHVVIIATGATAPKISQAGEYIFRIWNSDAYEGEVAADFAYDILGLRSVAILYINNDYGQGLQQVFSSRFTNRGGSIAIVQGVEQGVSDMRAQVLTIKSTQPDGLYLVGYPKEIPIALRQGREIGLKIPMIGTVAVEDPQLIQNAGEAAEGLQYPYPLEPTGLQVTNFKEAYKQKYSKEPGITADVGYDAVKMITQAIELSGSSSSDSIMTSLYSLKDYPGVSGTMTFDANGDVHKPMGIKKIINGTFQWRN